MSDYISEIFGAGGLFASRFPNYEVREGQVALARMVDQAMSSERQFFAHAVQWHPELTYTNLDFNLTMFRSHVEAASAYRARREQTVG